MRSLRVVDKIRESNDVTSIVLSARDGGPLTEFEAGQHLPVVLDVPAHATPVTRTYSLSNGPGGDTYRISVKREPYGLVSRHLHDQVKVGDIINSHPPAGDFVLAKADLPVVLISAGVGVTPGVVLGVDQFVVNLDVEDALRPHNKSQIFNEMLVIRYEIIGGAHGAL